MRYKLNVFLKTVALTCLIFLVGSCASHVRTSVSTYRGEGPLSSDATLYITPQAGMPADFDELEFKYFADRLAAQFTERGFQVVSKEEASHKAILQYDNERQKKESKDSRFRLHTAFGYPYRYGSVVLIDRGDYDQFEFARRVKVSIEENNEAAGKVVSLSAVSYGRCEHLASVFDEMVTAIMSNLNSQNGSITPVKVKTKRPCSGS